MSAGSRGVEEREALARVRACLAVAARIADPSDALGGEARERLPAVTGLSREGVELALREHLETAASEVELASFVARAREGGAGAGAPTERLRERHRQPTSAADLGEERAASEGRARCLVVLSANVCTAALRAIAFGCATAREVLVKASRRDPVVAEMVVRGLGEEAGFGAAGGEIALVDEGAIAELHAGDELHVYGADETIEALRGRLREGVVMRAHGTGLGLAVVEEDAEIDGAAEAVARDVIAFDQRGCLSPRVALVGGDAARARGFAGALAAALERANRRVPRGAIDEATAAALRVYTSTATALGDAIEGDGCVVGLDEAPVALVLPPAVRAVHVLPASAGAVPSLLAGLAGRVAAIGSSGAAGARGASDGGARSEALAWGALTEAVRGMAPRARVSALGEMQRPAFDGPVDLRARR